MSDDDYILKAERYLSSIFDCTEKLAWKYIASAFVYVFIAFVRHYIKKT